MDGGDHRIDQEGESDRAQELAAHVGDEFEQRLGQLVGRLAERAQELMQNEMTGARIAEEAIRLLDDPVARTRMRNELQEITAKLATTEDPIEKAARLVKEFFDEHRR